MNKTPGLLSLLVATALPLAALPVARADTHPPMPRDIPAAYTLECGACHPAYPPGMLPAGSWRRLMAGLDRHFGSDASLDAVTVRQLDHWLQTHAGRDRRTRESPPQDRITRSAWFEREHRKIGAAVWKLDSVKSAANCAACHGRVAQGSFDEKELRMPEGLDARQRRAWND